MVHHNEFSAWIEMGGVRCKEHQVTTDGFRSFPTEFTVHWHDYVVSSPTTSSLYVDGRYARCKTIRSPAINLYDEEALTSASNVGEIILRISRSQIIGTNKSFTKPFEILERRPVHERSRKAVPHQVTAGKELTAASVEFVINYRPLQRLIADRIAPAQIPGDLRRIHRKPTYPDLEDISVEESYIETHQARLNFLRNRRAAIECPPPMKKEEGIVKKEEEAATLRSLGWQPC
ncbi:hypothetical protein C8J56DRAFT_1062385 [Mycena floridula]|nr:hypothetical protein C8J56DRAFT_1062385 [Mycena floridula]